MQNKVSELESQLHLVEQKAVEANNKYQLELEETKVKFSEELNKLQVSSQSNITFKDRDK